MAGGPGPGGPSRGGPGGRQAPRTTLRKLLKLFRQPCHEMGSRTSKIDFSDFILGGFHSKITILMSICVRDITFDRFLNIFQQRHKMWKICFFQLDIYQNLYQNLLKTKKFGILLIYLL